MWIEFIRIGMVSSGTTWRGTFRLHTSWEVSHSNAWLRGPLLRPLLQGNVKTSQLPDIILTLVLC
jgi:hypothetical protein